jgi:NADH-quinone oxidoreductase subunit I
MHMPIAESDVRWVEAPKLGFWDQLYLPAMVDGLKTTLGHMFSK